MTDTATKEEIENLRKDFFKNYQKNIENGEFHEDDLKRLKENDEWIRAYFWRAGKKEKHEDTLTVIKDALKWRKDFGANDLLNPNKLPFPKDLLSRNVLYVKGTDKEGVALAHFNIRFHKKGDHTFEDHCKYIAYVFEQNYKFNYDHQLVIFFNLIGAGLGNIDMDLMRFVVNCVMYYYPRLAGYTIALEMPFLFEAAWKIIKLWLSPAIVSLVKFVKKSTVQEYITDEEVLKSL